MNSCTTSRVWSSMLMAGASQSSWPMTLGFVRPEIRPNYVHTWASWYMSLWRPSSVYDISAALSAKSISLVRTRRTLISARRRARLNTMPSVLECKHTPSGDGPKAQENSREKNIPKKVGAMTQSCFTPLRMGKDFDDGPSYCTVSCLSSLNEVTILSSFGGHPILSRSVKSPLLLTRSNAFVGSTKEMYNGLPFPTFRLQLSLGE